MCRLILVVLLASVLVTKPSVTTAQTSTKFKPAVVAHRGASADAPENTLAAFRLAWEMDANAIEGDFRLTADDQVVALHDATLQRTAGRPEAITELTYEQVSTLDAGSWKDDAFRGETIPTLAEVLDIVPEGKTILVEIKTGPEIVPFLRPIIEQSGLEPEQVTFIAFDSEVIAACKQTMPEHKAYWISGFRRDPNGDGLIPTVDQLITTAKQCRADGLDLYAAGVRRPEFVEAIRAAGLELHVWTVNDEPTARRCIELGVDSITTDRPDWLRGLLEESDDQ